MTDKWRLLCGSLGPTPLWIAHRGGGGLAPENTLSAFACGAHQGYRMFECDVQVSADGVPFLLHDATLERTSNAQGLAYSWLWSELARLDVGSWYAPTYAQENVPSLERIAHYCVSHGYALNIELKPSPGQEVRTGTVVAQAAAQYWAEAAPAPLLTSFQCDALEAARASQPHLPRGLLLNTWSLQALANALALDCVALVAQHSLWTEKTVQQAKQAGFRLLAYTVNDAACASRLIKLGVDGIITDCIDSLGP